MTAVKAFIRVSSNKKKIEKEVAVRFRVSDGRRIQLFYKSDILVDPAVWDPKRESIKPKILFRPMERVLFDESVRRMKTTLETVYQEAEDKDTLTSESLELLVDKKLHPENYEDEKVTRDRDFFNQFEYFLQVKNYPESDNKNYITMIRMLKRFQLYKTITNCSEWVLDFDTINVDTIREIEDFIRNEYRIVNHAVYKVIYEEIPEGRIPRPRGDNTIAKLMKRFRTFIKWCMKEGLLKTDPYVGYEQKSPMYGTPYYITIEERTKIYETNLHDAWEKLPEEKKTSIKESSIPQLERQRDIFIFQCMIGCRVGDLIHFTKKNLINGKICYIPHKTSHDRLDSIEVPLNETAKSILKRYADK